MKLRLELTSDFEVEKLKLEKVVKNQIKTHGLTGSIEVAVSLVTDERMAEINNKFRGKETATDVLSFPLEKEVGPDGVMRLGDIVVSFPEAKRQAKKNQRSPQEQIEFLVEHAMLHLLGVHHQ